MYDDARASARAWPPHSTGENERRIWVASVNRS